MGPKVKKALRLVLLISFALMVVLGAGDYALLRALVRFLCPSCVGIA